MMLKYNRTIKVFLSLFTISIHFKMFNLTINVIFTYNLLNINKFNCMILKA